MKSAFFRNKSDVLRVCGVVLLVIALIASVLLAVNMWDKNHSEYTDVSSTDEPKSTLEYQGQSYKLKDNIETMLVLGLDKFEHHNDDSYVNDKQADFLLLLVFDNENSTCSALQINRDTMAEIDILGVAGDTVGTEIKQIALAHTYGNGKEVSCRNTANAVSNLLMNVKIDHYVSVTMDAVPVFNDLVGGVEVTVLDDFTDIDDTLIKGETVTLQGDHALNYVRSRYGLDDSTNNSRMERQRQYLNGLYDKFCLVSENDSSFIVNTAAKISEYVVSDCSVNRLENYMEKIRSCPLEEIHTIDGTNSMGEEFIEFYPDEDSILSNVIQLFYEPQ